jgi:DNA polymerase III delta prime subunit
MENIIKLITPDSHSVLVVGELNLDNSCKLLNVSAADMQVIDTQPIKIEQIRGMIHWLNLRPMNSSKKVVIVVGAENMTTESANSLLKTLEEPPPYAQIILTTKNEQKILATIQSRCEKIRLTYIDHETLPENYLSPEELSKLSIKERFDWASKTADLESDTIKSVLTAWQVYFRQKLLKSEDCLAILKEISRAKDLLETNISVKLLLENVILNF